jgi:hypothetical protein
MVLALGRGNIASHIPWSNLVSFPNIGASAFVNAVCLLDCHDYHGFYLWTNTWLMGPVPFYSRSIICDYLGGFCYSSS